TKAVLIGGNKKSKEELISIGSKNNVKFNDGSKDIKFSNNLNKTRF
ncbi:39918_t:CDS:1, partial [Gigaspora margarita]